MTRYMDNISEIALSRPAGRPTLVDILTRPFRRAQIARELRMLDDRMLRDIGLTRSDIDHVAEESVDSRERIVVALAKLLVRKIVAWSSRRDAYRRLMGLDDRMLADIGLSRAEIPAVVKAMGGPALPAAEGSFEAKVILPLRQWNLWRDAHRQLGRLDNHMLSDIGLARGDIDQPAGCATAKPANANSTAPRAP